MRSGLKPTRLTSGAERIELLEKQLSMTNTRELQAHGVIY